MKFTIIKLTIFLAAGIVYASVTEISLRILISASTLLFILLGIFWYRYRKRHIRNIYFGITAFLLTFCLGAMSVVIHNPLTYGSHYSYHLKAAPQKIRLKLTSPLKPTANYHRYEAEVLQLDTVAASGRIILNISKSGDNINFLSDHVLKCTVRLQEIGPPLNPHQFDYKKYINNKGIYHQAYSGVEGITLVSSDITSIHGLAAQLRAKINESLVKSQLSSDCMALMNALLMGQRQEIPEEIYSNYINSGAVHILAVSGLHVGIILFILNNLLAPLHRIKRGRTIKFITILVLLWGFALLAGLSASVIRSVTMFSFLAYATNIRKHNNTYNILVLSMFFILLFSPRLLFEVGFQLSYAAVFSIIWIYPLLDALWQPRWKLIDHFRQILLVSIAAQAGVLPLSLFYFHQFPSLFFISNLAILPVLGLVLFLGILVILLSLFNITPDILVRLLELLTGFMNAVTSSIAHREEFIFSNIPFNLKLMVASYVYIVCSVFILQKFSRKRAILVMLSITALGLLSMEKHIFPDEGKKLIIFHRTRETIIAIDSSTTLRCYGNKILNTGFLDNYIREENISTTEQRKFRGYMKEWSLFIIDSNYNTTQVIPPDTNRLLLICSPQINLERAIDSLKPGLIIADGSNYKSYVERWKATCIKQKIPFHYTGERGAYILRQ